MYILPAPGSLTLINEPVETELRLKGTGSLSKTNQTSTQWSTNDWTSRLIPPGPFVRKKKSKIECPFLTGVFCHIIKGRGTALSYFLLYQNQPLSISKHLHILSKNNNQRAWSINQPRLKKLQTVFTSWLKSTVVPFTFHCWRHLSKHHRGNRQQL